MYNFCTSLPDHFLLVLKGQLVLCQVHPLCDMKFKIIISPDPHPVRALPRFRSTRYNSQHSSILPVFASYRYWQRRWEVIWKMFPKAQRAFYYHNVFIFLLKRRDELSMLHILESARRSLLSRKNKQLLTMVFPSLQRSDSSLCHWRLGAAICHAWFWVNMILSKSLFFPRQTRVM
jgi:hypothetical protein